MIVREPTGADRARVVRMGRDAFAPLGDYRRAMAGWLDNPGVATRVGVIDEDLVGFVMVAVLDDASGRHGYVLAIGVGRAHQRRGLGKELLAVGVALLTEERERLELNELRATVAEDNGPARALFEAAGFSVQGRLATVYQGGQTALTLSLTFP